MNNELLMAGTIIQEPKIGLKILTREGRASYIYAIEENSKNVFSLGFSGEGMTRIRSTIKIVCPEGMNGQGYLSELTELDLKHRAIYEDDSLSFEAVAVMVEEVQARKAAAKISRDAEREEQDKRVSEWRNDHADLVPSDAKAVIVANYHVSENDPHTDYFGHSVTKTIILGFSKHTRDLFPEMRKAAANAEETKHLAIKPEKPEGENEYWEPEDEHREKYSMGGGYYLGGWRNHNGWNVSKRHINTGSIDCVPVGDWKVPSATKPAKTAAPKQEKASGAAQSAGAIEEHTHTKHGFQMFIVSLSDRMDRADFLSMKAAAVNLGGWYSRKWGSTPCGFAFKELSTAQTFAADNLGGGIDGPSIVADSSADKPENKPVDISEKLSVLADKLQPTIDNKLGERQENTAKRIKEAASARQEGYKLQRTQSALYKLAELHKAGNVSDLLAGIKSKKAVYDCMGSASELVQNGFHSYYVDLDKPKGGDDLTLALWSLIESGGNNRETEQLKAKISSARLSGIAGFFGTVGLAADMVIEAAKIEQHHRCLEPSAGAGDLALKIREAIGKGSSGYVDVCEVNHSLIEILRLQGFDADPMSFLDIEIGGIFYDRIIMNPPFEKLQDIDHIKHAYSMLNDNGRLVCVMGAGAFFRSENKAVEFRRWLDSVGGTVENMPEGSFKSVGTSVESKLVIIDKTRSTAKVFH
jgi:hypothetical protein